MELEKKVLRRSDVIEHIDEYRGNGRTKIECAAYCTIEGCGNFTMGHLDITNLIFESEDGKTFLFEDLRYRCEKHRF